MLDYEHTLMYTIVFITCRTAKTTWAHPISNEGKGPMEDRGTCTLTLAVARCDIRALLAFAALAASLLVPSLADAAQAGTSPASITGQVKDGSGGVLPGVTVTASSPALQAPPMTAVTDAQGEYRLSPLPIGVYAIEYALTDFQTIRVSNIQLTVGFEARVDQTMKLGHVSEAVTVVAASPLVDTRASAVSTALTAQALSLIPSAKVNVSSLLALVPGVRSNLDVGGATVNDANVFIYNGQNGSIWTLLEGVLSGRQAGSGTGVKYDPSILEGMRIQTVGNSAEMPKRGMMLDLLVKSGGNDTHGILDATQTVDGLQSRNVDDVLRAQGISGAPKLNYRWDRAGQLGGRIVRDRLWYFGSYRRIGGSTNVLNVFNADGSPFERWSRTTYQAYKLTAQLNRTNRLIAFYHDVRSDEQGANGLAPPTQFNPPQSALEQHNAYAVAKVEWQATVGNAFVSSLQSGVYTARSWADGFDPGVSASIDQTTLMQDGMTVYDTLEQRARIVHNRGVATLFKPSLAGSHEFKIGFDNTIEAVNLALGDRPREGNYQLIYNRGVPAQINVFNMPVESLTNGFFFGGYIQDSWTIGKRLTLNLGVRASHDAASVPAQCQQPGQFRQAYPPQCFDEIRPNSWHEVSPRLHFAYDVKGDGKLALKGGWGRFAHRREVQSYEVTLLNQNGNKTSTYLWRDLNGNRNYDPGEVNLDPNGPDFVSTAGFGGPQGGLVNRGELQPYEDESFASSEWEVAPNLALRISGVYAKNHNVPRLLSPQLPYGAHTIPITSNDPGPDGTLGTADDTGQSMTYYEFPVTLRGARFAATQLVNNDSRNDTVYRTIEFGGTRRLANNWQLSGSYAYTAQRVPFGDAVSSPLPLNPNAEINVANNAPMWIGKLSGSYLFPRGLLGSFNYEARSGDPLARQVLFRGGTTIPTIVLNVDPIGSIRLPSIKLLDLRAGKQFRIRGGRLEVHADLYNATNINTATSVNVRSGSTFLTTTAIILPRVLVFGGRFAF
jgi:hypothetical protein